MPARTAIWPPFPITIWNMINDAIWNSINDAIWNSIIDAEPDADPAMPEEDAAIAHPDNVCEIYLYLACSQLPRLASAMQKPFPALIHLALEVLDSDDSPPTPALPDGFLGGSAPRLQSLKLNRISFPALPNLLLSATGLVSLALLNVPESGYISPEVIVTSLAVMPNLKSLTIEFKFPSPLPDRERRHPSRSTRTALPALTYLRFQGVCKYSEELMAQIDAPLLDTIYTTFHQSVFNIPELAKFMRRTTRFQAFNEAHVEFCYKKIIVQSHPPTQFGKVSGLKITCKDVDGGPSSLAQILISLFPSIYVVEYLYIYGSGYLGWIDDIQWLEIFHPFTAVRKLYISQKFAAYITPALQELVRERVTDVLPALECLFLEDLLRSDLFQEQLLGHPVTVSHWVR